MSKKENQLVLNKESPKEACVKKRVGNALLSVALVAIMVADQMAMSSHRFNITLTEFILSIIGIFIAYIISIYFCIDVAAEIGTDIHDKFYEGCDGLLDEKNSMAVFCMACPIMLGTVLVGVSAIILDKIINISIYGGVFLPMVVCHAVMTCFNMALATKNLKHPYLIRYVVPLMISILIVICISFAGHDVYFR